jgi:signal recognition particle GTPase
MNSSDEISNRIENLHLKVKQQFKEGNSQEQIRKKLTDEGIEPFYVETIFENIENEKSDKKNFRNSIIAGFFI